MGIAGLLRSPAPGSQMRDEKSGTFPLLSHWKDWSALKMRRGHGMHCLSQTWALEMMFVAGSRV